MISVLAKQVVQVCGATTPVPNDEYRGFLKSELFDLFSKIEVFIQLEWCRYQDDQEGQEKPEKFASVYFTHR